MPAGWPNGYSLTVRDAGTVLELRKNKNRTVVREQLIGILATTVEEMRLFAWDDNDVAATDEAGNESVATAIVALGGPVMPVWAALDTTGHVPTGHLGTGTADATTFLRGDRTFAAPPGGSGASLTRIAGASGAAGADFTVQRLTSDAAANATVNLATVMTTTGVWAGTWRFRYVIRYRSTALTTGVKFAVNHTGVTGAFLSEWRFISTGAAAATGVADQVAAVVTGQMMEGKSERVKNTASSASAGVDTINADMLAILEG